MKKLKITSAAFVLNSTALNSISRGIYKLFTKKSRNLNAAFAIKILDRGVIFCDT
jgi:hypothetical protein